MQETQVWSLGQEDPPEKEMAIHSSILAWIIPWTEKPRATAHGVANSQTQLNEWLTLLTLVRVILVVYVDNSSQKSCHSVTDYQLLIGLSRVQEGSCQVYGNWKSRKTSWFEVLILNKGHFLHKVFPDFQSL